MPAAALFAQRICLSAAAAAAMKDAYKNVFLIGTALDFRRPDEFTAAELELITSQFNAITPENSMKPGPVHPQEDTWNWTPPDALVSFCAEKGIKTFGHTLVWHSQTNPWFFESATRDVALQRLRTHIHTLVGRYKGKIAGWDVVNEAINDGGDATTARPRTCATHGGCRRSAPTSSPRRSGSRARPTRTWPSTTTTTPSRAASSIRARSCC